MDDGILTLCGSREELILLGMDIVNLAERCELPFQGSVRQVSGGTGTESADGDFCSGLQS